MSRFAILVFAFAGAAWGQQSPFIPSADGQTVYDTTLHVRWLANANLAGSYEGEPILALMGADAANIDPSGAMPYMTALHWVDVLNKYSANGQLGYLGHTQWTQPFRSWTTAWDRFTTSAPARSRSEPGYFRTDAAGARRSADLSRSAES